MSKIQEAADERLKALISKSTKVLFVCEVQDRKSLELLLSKSVVFPKDKIIVLDANEAERVDKALESASFAVYFTESADSCPFLESVIDKAMAKKIGGVHVKGNSKSIIPAKISAYRIRSISWRELETIFK